MTREGFLEKMISGLSVKKQVGLTQGTGGRMLVQNSPDRGAAGMEAMGQGPSMCSREGGVSEGDLMGLGEEFRLCRGQWEPWQI